MLSSVNCRRTAVLHLCFTYQFPAILKAVEFSAGYHLLYWAQVFRSSTPSDVTSSALYGVERWELRATTSRFTWAPFKQKNVRSHEFILMYIDVPYEL